MRFDSLEEMLVATAEAVRPPERLTVSEAAERFRYISNPGSYVGPLRNSMTPYMIEPMDELASLDYTGLIFVGPAQTGKTDALLLNWLTHTAMCDPADMMFIQTSQSTARDFAKRRIERLYRHSPKVGDKRLPGRNNQNTFDTKFQSGMLFTMSWPTINELSGKPIPRLALTDYDRMPQDIDEEGSPFDLARKRATSFRRYGMTLAESSPGFEIENPKWMPSTKHEAPPTKGILSLYNRGDRRRFYWRCPHCSEPFEPDFNLIHYPETKDMMEAAEAAHLNCPHCGCMITHEPSEQGGPGKHELNIAGRWVKDGMIWMPDGSMQGKPIRTDIASFWMKGVCAAFTDWKGLVFNYLKAMEEFENNGSEEALKTTINTDQGLPYKPMAMSDSKLPEEIKARAKELGEGVVPEGVRFLIATIDVQKNRFEVQVHGFGVGGDVWVIDRYNIKKSKRLDEEGEHLWVKPGAESEDWHVLIEQVLEKTYPLSDGSGRHMMPKAFGCDSGGAEKVTTNAYNFWRYLRDKVESDFYKRLLLIKGSSIKTAPRVQVSFPDSDRKDRKAGARGEVPVLMINGDMIKDQLSLMLDRDVVGSGVISYPEWLPDWWYSEMVAETRTKKGWENLQSRRNEAWDLLMYAQAIALSRLVQIEKIDWEKPPGWAKDWDENDLVFLPEENPRPFESKKKDVSKSLSRLAESLG